jgi:hypothetical protein
MDVTASLTSNLTTLVSNLFHYYLTYLNLFIGRRIIKNYNIKFFG